MIADFGFDLAGRREPRLQHGLVLGIAAAFVEAVPYFVLCHVLQALFEGRASWALAAGTTAALLLATILLILLKARANIANYGATYGLVADARLRLADRLARLPMGSFTTARRAVIAELLTGRFNLYQGVISHAWGVAAANAALPAFLWLALLAVDWRIALAAAVPLPLAFLAIPWSHRLLTRASARLADRRNDLVAALVEQIEGMRDLRQFDDDDRLRRQVEAGLLAFERAQLRAELAPAPALLAFATILHFGFALTAVAGALVFADGSLGTSALVLSLVLALRLYRAVADLGFNLAELRFARDVLARIRCLMAEPPMAEGSSGVPASAEIRFEDVSFAYDSEAAALHHIDGTIPAGAMVALVGPSGSGKSTLAHLVARLWDVGSGAIRIGGVDLRELEATALNRTVAMVLQEVVLFEGTVADNIRLGRPDAPDAAVEVAARAARAHDFILALPDGYETRLDPAGGPLSGGERQRIAIARALLKDAPILVLDEATASLDLENEAEIQAALAALARGRTRLVIAHRLWTVTQADEIWVMEGGRIVERGRHEQLMALPAGRYRRLWEAQMQARDWRLAAGAGEGDN